MFSHGKFGAVEAGWGCGVKLIGHAVEVVGGGEAFLHRFFLPKFMLPPHLVSGISHSEFGTVEAVHRKKIS